MFKKIMISTIICILTFALSISVNALDLSAKSSALIEADSNEVVYENNAHDKLPMASTTKIMTSLIVLEYGMPNLQVKTTDDMLRVEGTSIGLKSDDTITLKNLVYGMLLESGNDAANVSACSVGKSCKDFSVLMNNRAEQIGMNDTHFVTPSGLDAKEHYSTAYDMALLGAQAIKNPEFREICSTESKRVSFGNPPCMRTFSNHNLLLKKYPYSFGIKTGFTKKSGRCLVSAAEKDGVVLVAVTLNAGDDWNDHIKMYDYGFSQYECINLDSNLNNIYLNVVGSKTKKVKIKMLSQPKATVNVNRSGNIKRVIHLSKFEYAPLQKGKVVGKALYYLDDKIICEEPIVTDESVKSCSKIKKEKSKSFFKRLIK